MTSRARACKVALLPDHHDDIVLAPAPDIKTGDNVEKLTMVDILVLGATGFTGRLITQYLYNHPQRSTFSFAIGVRSQAKAETLKQSLGLDDSVKFVQFDVTNYEQVEAAVKDSKVVINTVGPFWLWGTNVVRACALHGKRYVDINGEPYFVRSIIDNFDYLATKTGAVIVPSCGLDSLPADISVYLSNRTLKSALGAQAQLGLSQSFYSLRVKPSGGTLSTLITMIEKVPRVRVAESYRDYALSPVRGARSPREQPAVPVPFTSPSQYGALWPMGRTNRAIVQRSFGVYQYTLDNARALFGDARAKEKKEQFQPLAYGSTFSYAEYLVPKSGSYFAAVLHSTVLAAVVGLLLIAPIRWVVKKFLTQAGDGPSQEEMDKGFLKLTNYTETFSLPKTFAKSVIHGDGDPGYRLTACMISECALGLLLDDAALPPSARPGGVLTPATALGDVIVRRLEATGKMRFESEIIKGNEESRKGR